MGTGTGWMTLHSTRSRVWSKAPRALLPSLTFFWIRARAEAWENIPSDYSVCDSSLSTGAWSTEPKSSSLLSLIGCGGGTYLWPLCALWGLAVWLSSQLWQGAWCMSRCPSVVCVELWERWAGSVLIWDDGRFRDWQVTDSLPLRYGCKNLWHYYLGPKLGLKFLLSSLEICFPLFFHLIGSGFQVNPTILGTMNTVSI